LFKALEWDIFLDCNTLYSDLCPFVHLPLSRRVLKQLRLAINVISEPKTSP